MDNFGSVPLQPGEMGPGEEYERPLSAPPPPGFGTGIEERNRLANEVIWGSSIAYGEGGGTAKNDPFQHHINPAIVAAATFSAGATTAVNGSMLEARTSSFNNLASVLGTGLVESMDDVMQDRLHSNHYVKDDLLSYHRMARHAASRLMRQPASPPKFNDPVHSPDHGNGAGSEPPDTLYAHQHIERKEQNGVSYSRAPGESGDVSTKLQNKEDSARVFSWSLSTQQRSTTPVQMFPGQQTGSQRRALPVSKDIGMSVMEPEGENHFNEAYNGVVSQRIDPQPHMSSDPTLGSDSNRSMKELERGVRNMWSPEAREFKPASSSAGPPSVNSSISEQLTEMSPRQLVMDLQPFLWDADANGASRTLALLNLSWVRVPDIRIACETFGVLESFRADFSSRGVYFVSYYDIRSAQYAAVELQSILQRLSVMQRSSEEVAVCYCLSLSSSSQFDESRILISNLPANVKENSLKAMLSSYGAMRSVIYMDEGSYLIEFQNLQDTKQALLELDSSQPWGPDVLVEVSIRNSAERRRGRELLALIGRLRHDINRANRQQAPYRGVDKEPYQRAGVVGQPADPWRRDTVPSQHYMHETPQPQYIQGSDGRYTQLLVPQQQQVVQGVDGQIYVVAVAQHSNSRAPHHVSHHAASFVTGAPYGERRQQRSTTPYYSHVVMSDTNSLSGRSQKSALSHATEDKDNRNLMLDLDAVELGEDSRTSLMVRNIPNKYTQQMLLSEFEANGHGPGVIDFFYLPIDFKNRCNRGYAFINFVDCKDILAFHRRYYGKHWRTFNSDKICDITYARIQGKDAMLKRFENSALMEKDDEYKPLVFASEGPAKGTRLPFPDS